jgi:hypothetical protein
MHTTFHTTQGNDTGAIERNPEETAAAVIARKIRPKGRSRRPSQIEKKGDMAEAVSATQE